MDNFEQLPSSPEEKKMPGPAFPQASLADISPAPALPHANQPQSKGRRPKFLLIFLIIIFVILVSAGGAFAYAYNYKPELMPSFLSSFLKPQDVLKRMYLASSDIKSFEFDGSDASSISYEPAPAPANEAASGTAEVMGLGSNPLAPETPGNFSLNFSYQGAVDWHDKSDLKLIATTGVELGGNGLDLGLFKIPPFKLDLNLRKWEQTIFAKANLTLQGDNGILAALPVDASQYLDRWVRFDLASSTSTSTGEELNLKDAFDKYQQKFQLTEAQLSAIKKLLYNSNIIKVTAKLPDEKIGGVDAFHYRISYDISALIKFVEAADDITNGKILADVNKADWIKQMSEAKIPESEIWIGKQDFLPYQGYFASTSVTEFAGLKVTVKSASTLKMKNYNQPVTVEKPTSSETLDELLGNTLGNARLEARDAERVAEIRQVQTALELYYSDIGRYPAAVDFSGSGSISSNGVTYLNAIPSNPLPRNDGSCPDQNFSYSADPEGKSYQLSYCLGGEAGGVPAGPNIASPAGISNETSNGSLNEPNPGGAASSSAVGDNLTTSGASGVMNSPYIQSVIQSNTDSGMDSDHDGLTDWQEIHIYHTNPYNADTDGDGYSDGAEVNAGYNPNGPGKLSVQQ